MNTQNDKKRSKESVDYGRGMPKRHCGICVHFEPPNGTTYYGRCELVAGQIGASGWCELFKRKAD